MTLAGRSVLVTGGTGTFGQAFARRALDDGAARVAIVSRSESKQAAMREILTDARLRFFIGDVRDESRMLDALRGVQDVVHAAALKRVETCEADPREAVATNISGTLNVARACAERGVERAVFLSTDKAAAPHTLYGASKMAGERLWLASNVYAGGRSTRFAATRYGNVLGSTGSVVPQWRALLATAGFLKPTITDVHCTRFWMSLAGAVDLVCAALAAMRGGEVFIPKIGSAPLVDLYRAVVESMGIVPTDDVPTVTGLRPGEKLHETLVSADEARHTHDAGACYIIEPETRSWGEVERIAWPLVPEGFTYQSDAPDHRLANADLRRMISAAGHGSAWHG